jgi:two-component system osmolarity sensor histidine kinase EnvZ
MVVVAAPEESRSSLWAAYTRFWRQVLPRGLFARSLLIVILPMLVLQSVVAAVFMERHWQLVTTRLSSDVTRDIAGIIDLLDTYPDITDYSNVARIAQNRLGLAISVEKGTQLPAPKPVPLFSILDQTLSNQIENQIHQPYWLNTTDDSRLVEIRIKLDNGRILKVVTHRDRTYASNTHIFLVWMVGTALVLISIAILFLRGQIRPILKLAEAAENFGKGQKPAEPYSPRGADEVRRAGLAFLQMRERIERQMEQRTAMLTGVSHDLRTILTRFRLQLAIAESPKDLEGLSRDVDDMSAMLEGYLAFARGQTDEEQGEYDLDAGLLQLQESSRLHGKSLAFTISGTHKISVKPNAFNRLLTNLVANAWRHADTINIEAKSSERFLTITIDDDGPGIPENMREEVFKPFFRLDEARNLDASGTGLGLAIARGIARAHGGNVVLGDSPLGGLRASVRVPV